MDTAVPLDMSAKAGAPAGMAAGPAGDDSPFNAFLARLVGDASGAASKAGTGLSLDGDDDTPTDADDPSATDSQDLDNTLAMAGVPVPMSLAPVLPTLTAVPAAAAVPPRAVADAASAMPDGAGDVRMSLAMKDVIEQAASAMDATPGAVDAAAVPPTGDGTATADAPATGKVPAHAGQPPQADARAERGDVSPVFDAAVAASTPSADGASPSAVNARASGAAQAASGKPAAANTASSASARTIKADRGKTDGPAEPTAAPAVPMAAVERAYASRDRESSRSFDGSKDGAPMPRTQAAAGPTAAAGLPFAIAIDQRTPTPVSPATVIAGEPTSVVDAAIEANVPMQIVHSIRLQAVNGGGEATIRLNPDYLGEVVVAVKVAEGSVTAALQADTPAVRQWVERNEQVLRQALADQGLQLDRLTVSEAPAESETSRDGDGPSHQQSEQESPRQQPRRRRTDAGDATFEVTV